MGTKIKKSKKIYLIKIVIIFLLAVFALIIFLRDVPETGVREEPKTTSQIDSAQKDYSSGSSREPVPTQNDKGSAEVSDNKGEISSTIDSELWTYSDTNEITLYTPGNNQLLKSGDVVEGESSLDSVNFRLIDNVSGVISMGQISVVDGKFSGTINFNTKATEGRLDIYATSVDGSEYSSLEIPINFSSQ